MLTPPTTNLVTSALLVVCLVCTATFGQQQPPKPQSRDDVLRIDTELVQTAVTVFDKQGQFVDGLKKEDFELRVDDRLVPISFFENILAGSQRDRVASVRGTNESPAGDGSSALSLRQRTIIFFLDDRHLSLDSVNRTRNSLSDFINNQMGQNDLVAIASASGRIGFLQQFTDNKDVLRAAAARISHVPYVVSDYGGNPSSPLTETMALTIERKDDPNVFDFYVQDCMKWAPKGTTRQERASIRRHCEVEVQNRARQILSQAGAVTSDTYFSLEALLRSSGRMPGSKLAFFISDGFLADTGPRGSIASDRLGRITDEARRAGVVIYTIDARGLISGALDATGNVPFDPSGRLETANARAIAATQDAMNALAGDTGGRALRNQHYFDPFIKEALSETSRFYLIAWRPDGNDGKNVSSKKIQIGVKGRPELTVRSARGFVSNRATASTKDARTSVEALGAKKQESKADAELRGALEDFYARHAIALRLSLVYLDTPANGAVLTSSVQASTTFLSYGNDDRDPAQLTLAGVVLDDHGKPAATFRTSLKVNPTFSNDGNQSATTIVYNYPSPVKPGIYQVRVAARDHRSGIMGSAADWIVIPDISTRQLLLSSLMVGLENVASDGGESGRVQWSVDKKFAQNSRLRFMSFVYNIAQPLSNNLSVRVEVYQDGNVVISTPFKTIQVDKETDPQRVPIVSEINLAGLRSGRYLLEVTVTERNTQRTASQRTTFDVR